MKVSSQRPYEAPELQRDRGRISRGVTLPEPVQPVVGVFPVGGVEWGGAAAVNLF